MRGNQSPADSSSASSSTFETGDPRLIVAELSFVGASIQVDAFSQTAGRSQWSRLWDRRGDRPGRLRHERTHDQPSPAEATLTRPEQRATSEKSREHEHEPSTVLRRQTARVDRGNRGVSFEAFRTERTRGQWNQARQILARPEQRATNTSTPTSMESPLRSTN